MTSTTNYLFSTALLLYKSLGERDTFSSKSQARTVGARSNAGDAALGVAGVLGHALDLREPVGVADDGRTHRVFDVEVLEVLLDVGRRLAKRGTLLGALRLAVEPDVLGEP